MKCREKPLLALMLTGQTTSWRIESSSKAAPLGHEAVFLIKTLTGPVKAEMKLVFFDDKHCNFRVAVNNSRYMAKPFQEIGDSEQALAVCNGGYFHVDDTVGPAGLEIAGGKRADEFRGDRGWVGALMVRQDKASLILEKEFQDAPDIREFVQCSPWLIDQGSIAPLLLQGQDQRNRRTFILTDGAGHWRSAFVIASGCENSRRSSSRPASSRR